MTTALHPQAAGLLDSIKAGGGKPMAESTVEEARAAMAGIGAVVGPGPELAEVRDMIVPGVREIPVRVYTPAGEPAGVIVYTHGGGWVVGTLDDFDAACRKLAEASGCEVVSVAYALAPEHPFPAAPDDAYAATAWAAETIAAGRPLVVLGDSSGGTLAAVTARRARDLGGPAIALQVLLYPVVDADFTTPSYLEFGEAGYLNSTADMQWFWDHYLPDVDARANPDASPLQAEDLSGLPPAVVLVAGYDLLRDEDRAYASALEAAGVPTTVIEVPDQIHAFWTLVNIFESADAYVVEVAHLIGEAVR